MEKVPVVYSVTVEGGGTSDHKVLVNEKDSLPNYLQYKLDPNYFYTEDNQTLKFKADKFALVNHTHTLNQIQDFPTPTKANTVLLYDGSDLVWSDITTSDEKVKADPNDSTPGYLSDKVDSKTIVIDTTNHTIKVADDVFAPIDHTHTIESLDNVDSTNKQKNTTLLYDGNKYVFVYYNPNLSSEVRDFLASLDNICKSYAIYIAQTMYLPFYIIYVPQDGDMIEDRLIQLNPGEEKVFSLDITNTDGIVPSQLVFDIVMNPNLKLQYSFDGETFQDYSPLQKITPTSNTLYVKIINDSTELKFTYAIIAVTN